MTSRMAPATDQFSGFFFHGSAIPRPRTEEPIIETPEPGQSLPPASEDAKRAYRMIFLNEFSTAAPPPCPQPPRQQQHQNVAPVPATNRQQQAPLPVPAAPPAQPRLLPPPQQQLANPLPPRQQQQQQYQQQQNVVVPQQQTYQAPPTTMPSLPAPLPLPAAAPPPQQGPFCPHGVPYTACSHRADHLQHVIGQLADYADKLIEAEDPAELAQLKQQCKELRELRKLLQDAPPLQQQQGHAAAPPASLQRQYSAPPASNGGAFGAGGSGYPPQQQQYQQQQQHYNNQPGPGAPGSYQQPPSYGNNGPSYPAPYNNNNNGFPPQAGGAAYPSAYQPLPLQPPGAPGGAAAPAFGAGAGAGMYNNNGPPMYPDNGYGNGGPPLYNQQQHYEEFVPYEPDRVALAALNTNVIDASVDPQWRRENFEWSAAMKQKNTDQFGNTRFRHTQLGVLNATMAGKDVFVLMPTGGGKSLCYQLPAVLSYGVTLVISPLTSLIQDQVAHLEILGIPSVSMTGASWEVRKGIERGEYKVVFMTPEKLFSGPTAMTMLEKMYNNNILSRVVVDEAHCVSNWGHDFRPHYTRLSVFKQKWPSVPVLALTATATPRVQRDVTLQLGLDSCLLFRSSFNRPKLYLEIKEKKKEKETLDEIASLISAKFSTAVGRHRTPTCGIIYCTATSKCEEVADKLEALMEEKMGRPANPNKRRFKPYHARLEPAVKEATQQEWSSGELPVVVATIAFGMGINKPDVRFVIHFSVAKSLEGYLQESGRAGRDGLDAHCLLYFSWADVIGTKKLLQQGNEELIKRGGTLEDAERQMKVNLESVNTMAAFCIEKCRCRREMLLEHFGEKFSSEQCRGTCDNCRRMTNAKVVIRDVTQPAEIVLNILRNVSGFTASGLVAVFRGTKDSSHAGKDAINQGFSGAGKNLNLKSSEVEQILRRMITMDVIEEQLEIHQGRATISRLAVNERKVAELTAGGQRPLRVEITALGEAGPARSTSPARVTNAAGPSAAAAAAVGAPAEKKAARKKKPKAAPATLTAAAAAPLPQVINLVSDDDENDDEDDLSRNPEVKLRFDIMCAMLRQLSVVLKEHTAGRRIPLSTSVQQKIAKNPPKTLDDINKMTISGFNTHMKKRFGPALLAGVVQADSHLLSVKAEMATVEDFILDKVTVLAKLAHVNPPGASAVVAGQQQQQQQHQNYYYPQPPKTTTHANGNAGTANKRPRDEDLDWGDDSDDDDDDWGGIAAVNVHPQAAALAPYQQQQQQQRQQQVQQPHQPQQQQKFNYLAQNPPPQFPTEDNNSPTTIAAFRPPNYTNNTIKNAINPINDGVPLVQRQKLLKAKLQQDVASAAGPKAPPPYNAHPGQVKSMAVKDINNAFG